MQLMVEEKRSVRKRRAILEAAASAFLNKGYPGTNMDEIAALAGVSKRTVYQHFSDKETLFREIVLATTDEIDVLVQLVSQGLGDSADVGAALCTLGRRLLDALMEPDVLRLRRLVIASADRFPGLGEVWYQQGFGRVLSTLSDQFRRLMERGVLRAGDPMLAADHFVGLLLWIPINRAMFTGDHHRRSEAELQRFAEAAADAFQRAYRRDEEGK
jgi:TetR/AcrR family transcriptional regulator, mexJK operon transcriptional repressor